MKTVTTMGRGAEEKRSGGEKFSLAPPLPCSLAELGGDDAS